MKYIIEYFFELNPFDDDSLSTSVTERQLILEANDINEAEKIGRSLIDTLASEIDLGNNDLMMKVTLLDKFIDNLTTEANRLIEKAKKEAEEIDRENDNRTNWNE